MKREDSSYEKIFANYISNNNNNKKPAFRIHKEFLKLNKKNNRNFKHWAKYDSSKEI